MAFQNLLIVSIFLPLIFAIFTSAATSLLSEETATSADENDAVYTANPADEFLHHELQRLKSKISLLEISIEEKIRELRSKDESIKQLAKIIEEKSSSLASLRSEVQLLQDRGYLDASELVEKVNAHASKLEKQMVNLKKETEGQNRKKDELETRGNVAEKKIDGMNLKLESLRRINAEQRTKIHKSEHALQVAEEEMLKAKLEASLFSKQIKEIHQAWLPPWLSVHVVHFKSTIMTNWNEQGKPALDLIIQKALEKLSEVEKWAQPQFETFETKWVLAVKEGCMALVSDIGPRMQSLANKAIDTYQVMKSTFEPHIMKIQDIIDPYFQEAKMFAKPHIDQVSRMVKPHVDKARVFFKPYSKKITENVHIYHSQVRTNLHETLNSYEFTRALATEELVCYMASILMALPAFVLLRILLRKEPKKNALKTRTGHRRRRVKQKHPDL